MAGKSRWIRGVLLLGLILGVAVGLPVKEGRKTAGIETVQAAEAVKKKTSETIRWDPKWKYAKNSAIHSGKAKLYYAKKNRKDIVVCVNAGHGTKGGSNVKTLCHPDGSAKVTSGSTAKGAKKATAVAYGTTMKDGTPEHKVTLKLAKVLKKRLLETGYDVLMIREGEDVQLDNIARTVMANNKADCHIALHYDSTMTDKGVFYMSVPKVKAYRSMEPVASLWKEHEKLGKALIRGLEEKKVKIFSGGSMAMDLTQTSYSTISSIDLEVGDRASDYSEKTLERLAKGIIAGINKYFK